MDSTSVRIVCDAVLFLFALYGILIAIFGKIVLHLRARGLLVIHIVFAWLATRQVFWGINIPSAYILNIYDLRAEAFLVAGILWVFSLIPLLFRNALLMKKSKDKSEEGEEPHV